MLDREERIIQEIVDGGCCFAFWSLPGSAKWELILQNDAHLHKVDRFDQEGFIIGHFEGSRTLIKKDQYFTSDDIPSYLTLSLSEWGSEEDEMKVISKEDYLTSLRDLIDDLKDGSLDKVVLSRLKKVGTNKSNARLFLSMLEAYPEAMVFMYSIDGDLWLGASPERFLSIENDHFSTMALAGSKPIESDREWTEKEIEEQKYVADYMEDVFRSLDLPFQKFEREEVKAGQVLHLRNQFKGEVSREKRMDLFHALHPTPAVCGIPKKKAMEKILELELHEREHYTGFLGPISENKMDTFVNLRSAKKRGEDVFLFLGGGILKDSDPNKEWEETEWKARTILNIL